MNIFECNPKLKVMSISNVLIEKKERELRKKGKHKKTKLSPSRKRTFSLKQSKKRIVVFCLFCCVFEFWRWPVFYYCIIIKKKKDELTPFVSQHIKKKKKNKKEEKGEKEDRKKKILEKAKRKERVERERRRRNRRKRNEEEKEKKKKTMKREKEIWKQKKKKEQQQEQKQEEKKKIEHSFCLWVCFRFSKTNPFLFLLILLPVSSVVPWLPHFSLLSIILFFLFQRARLILTSPSTLDCIRKRSSFAIATWIIEQQQQK